MPEKKLNEKQKKFARALLKHKFNQTKAYIEAYPECSESAARINASRLMAKADINEYIQNLVEKEEKKDMVTIEYIIEGVKETLEEAFSDGQYNVSMKGYELLGKYLSIWSENVNTTVSNKDNNPLVIRFEE